MRLPRKTQWVQIFTILSKKEKMAFFAFSGLFFLSLFSLLFVIFWGNTEIVPGIGGKYTEGMVGSPRFINPLYAQGSDVDRTLVELIFSGLFKYDGQGKIVPDLAKNVEIKDDGRTYEVHLSENLSWHDGEPFTADDVIFTLKTIQSSDYKSPLRGNYLGIEIEKIDNIGLRFKLKAPYSGFLERLTFKIIPKHIWENISPQNFLLTNYNLRPIGSGRYKLKDLSQDNSNKITSVVLARFGERSHIAQIVFKFFETEKNLTEAAKQGKIDGFSIDNPEYYSAFPDRKTNEYALSLPRYFAVFLNSDKSRLLGDDNIRKALNFGIDKKEITENILLGKAEIVDSPVLPQIFGLNPPSKIYEFNKEKAAELLGKSGLTKKGDGTWVKTEGAETVNFVSDLKVGSQGSEVRNLQTCLARDAEVYPSGKVTGYFGSETKAAVVKFQEKRGFSEITGLVGKNTRAKLNEICSKPAKETPLKFSLATVENPVLRKVAENIKEQLGKIGVLVDIQFYSVSQIEQEIIKPRNYEMLLFGEVLEIIPDPYSFWHSSQIKDPGLNLAKYENKSADKLLEAARLTLDETVRAKKYSEFQEIVIESAPAIFLYNPEYMYYVSKNIKGIETKIIADPSKRLADIENWYIKTKRVRK